MGSLANPGGCCQRAPPEQLLSWASIQGWDTQGALRAGTASQLSGICLHHQSWSQAPLGLFFQKHPFLLLQRSKRCFFSGWAVKAVDSMSTLPNTCPGKQGLPGRNYWLASEEAKLPEILNTPHCRHRSMQLSHLACRSLLFPTQVIPLLKSVILGKK